jgi:octaprenyl-diphosphate synthase
MGIDSVLTNNAEVITPKPSLGGLADIYPPLDNQLARVEEVIRQLLADDAGPLGQAGNHAIFGRGKRLRPALLLLSAAACGGDEEQAVNAAAVVEVVHSASLVHDDVVDEAGWRRGKESVRSLWGNKISVLLGDYLLCRVFALAIRKLEVHTALQDLLVVAQEMCQGQVAELAQTGGEVREEEYLQIVSGKTASLFGYCGRQGARCGKVPEAVVDLLHTYAHSFGMAFQIADDIHDLVGAQEDSGKPVNHDLRQRKVTLPLIHALQKLQGEQRAAVIATLANPTLSEEQLVQLRQVARASGGVDYAWSVCRGYLDKAHQALEALPAQVPALSDKSVACLAYDALLLSCREAFPLPILP